MASSNNQPTSPAKNSLIDQLRYLLILCWTVLNGVLLWIKGIFKYFLFSNYKNQAYESGIKNNPIMNGNFAPIHDELTITKLPIISGEIPKDLNGIYARIGPNPQFNPLYNLHWFEGDGHIHALEFKDGNCSYRNRFVQTEKYLQEKENGRPLAHSMIMDGGINPLLKYTYHYLYERMYRGLNGPLKKGGGAANTNIIYHGGKFLALEEGHKPMEVTFPDLKTVGEFDFKGKLKHNFTAHPKIDPRNGEMIFFGYELNPRGTSFRYGVTIRILILFIHMSSPRKKLHTFA